MAARSWWRRPSRLHAAAALRRAAMCCILQVNGRNNPDTDIGMEMLALADQLDGRIEQDGYQLSRAAKELQAANRAGG